MKILTVIHIRTTIVIARSGIDMDEPKLQISPKKYTGDSTVVSIRIPKDMLQDIERISSKTGRTRNELMTTCLEFALDHLEVEER